LSRFLHSRCYANLQLCRWIRPGGVFRPCLLFLGSFYGVLSRFEQTLTPDRPIAEESIWPGMFQAKAERGNTANVSSTRDAISDTVASYAISDEQGGKKKDSGQPAMNRSKQTGMGKKTIVILLISLAPSHQRPHGTFRLISCQEAERR
jgi:hypothetical protein